MTSRTCIDKGSQASPLSRYYNPKNCPRLCQVVETKRARRARSWNVACRHKPAEQAPRPHGRKALWRPHRATCHRKFASAARSVHPAGPHGGVPRSRVAAGSCDAASHQKPAGKGGRVPDTCQKPRTREVSPRSLSRALRRARGPGCGRPPRRRGPGPPRVEAGAGAPQGCGGGDLSAPES